MTIMNNSWDEVFDQEIGKDYLQHMRYALAREYKSHPVYPPKEQIFAALQAVPIENVKCVILGQDPYHGPGQAHGMAFSVNHGVAVPPSLRNMYKEIEMEYQHPLHRDGNLEDWARDGVLLLNPILTVVQGKPLSHQGLGWQNFTNAVIDRLEKEDRPVVYLLWGAKAKEAARRITNPKHLILTAPHPSPLSASRGFFGCGHFRQANEYLQQNGITPIRWDAANIQ